MKHAFRNHGCRIRAGLVWHGFQTITLENEVLRLTILPGKGTDIVEILHKPTDTDFSWWTSLGLRSRSSVLTGFQENYEGGWQELFPSLSPAHDHRGSSLPAYGEACCTQWDAQITTDRAECVAVTFTLELRTMPFRIEKRLELRAQEASFEILETITNLAPVPVHADWGHHITFGEPFLRPGTRITLPNGRTFIAPERGSSGGFEVITDFDHGEYKLERDDGIGARVTWDATQWPHLWFWRDFGGETSGPYYGQHYNVGLEMFTSPPSASLEESIQRGTALRFEAGSSHTAHLDFDVHLA